MSDMAVEGYSRGEATELQEYAEAVIGAVETQDPAEILEVELVGVPSVSTVWKPSIRSRMMKTLSHLRSLRKRRDVAYGEHYLHTRAISQDPGRHRYDVPPFRFP
jgi:hypothetical protein